jgi:hypothetical protein
MVSGRPLWAGPLDHVVRRSRIRFTRERGVHQDVAFGVTRSRAADRCLQETRALQPAAGEGSQHEGHARRVAPPSRQQPVGSGVAMAHRLRMKPTSPPPSLKFPHVGFPQYGFQGQLAIQMAPLRVSDDAAPARSRRCSAPSPFDHRNERGSCRRKRRGPRVRLACAVCARR